MLIHAYGKELDTKYFDGFIDTSKLQMVRDNFYTTTKEQATAQLEKLLLHKGKKINHIYGYYFEEIANDGVMHHSKYSLNQVINHDELLQVFINKAESGSAVFSSDSLVTNVRTAMRLGGKGIAQKLSNFPYWDCVSLLDKYTKTGAKVYIDPSCGWGVRMLASAYLGLGYIGFDVNPKLIDKLNELGEDIKKIKPEFTYGIIPQGSEIYLPSLEGSADIIMTSPPYYMLEDYTNVLPNSTKIASLTYSEWVESFVTPLMSNLYKYAKKDTFVLINIKDYKTYTLVDDFISGGVSAGFTHVGFDSLKNMSRVAVRAGYKTDTDEGVIVFKKGDGKC